MVTKRSQRRPDSSSLCDAIMDAVRSGSLPKSPIHATTEVVAVAKPWAVRYPKETAPAAGGRATELSHSPPARRQGVPSGTNIRRSVIAARHKGALADTVDPCSAISGTSLNRATSRADLTLTAPRP